ncbi:MAG: STAS/SEC14 domain-containing protein [Anaerolineae bacterium]|jgi:hypothetical protein|nr:STAS/SEC14 domain-containing protein [Anaerolineae bacterium]
MAHTVRPTQHPQCVQIEIHGELTFDDMTCSAELGLGQGQPRWVLLDVSEMDVALPEHFIEASRKSWFMHPDLVHMAVYTRSSLLGSAARMIAKLTRSRERMTIHDSREKAEAHLRDEMLKAGV